jgi:hypothetical protein
VITQASDSISLGGACAKPLFLSRAGAGYFVVDYPKATRAALRKQWTSLTPAERISFHGNEWLLVRNGRRDVAEYLALVRSVPVPADRQLVTQIADNLLFLDQRFVTDANRKAWQAFVRTTMRSAWPCATWMTRRQRTPSSPTARCALPPRTATRRSSTGSSRSSRARRSPNWRRAIATSSRSSAIRR